MFGFGFNTGGKTNAGGYFNPVVVGFPVVSSESDPIIVGSVLECSTGTWIPLYEPINFSYQWYENGVAIDGETGISVTTTSSGEYYCKVTATNDLGNSTTVNSNKVTVITV
jgi:PKD repeat protein